MFLDSLYVLKKQLSMYREWNYYQTLFANLYSAARVFEQFHQYRKRVRGLQRRLQDHQ